MSTHTINRTIRALGRGVGAVVCGLVLVPALLACAPQGATSSPQGATSSPQAAGSTVTGPATSTRAVVPAGAPTLAPDASGTPQTPPRSSLAPATPNCSNLTLTPAQTEGPYYKAGSPERTSLVDAGMSGTKLVLTGYVLTPDCKPVAGAWLDFWQADASGNYDNSGYTLRGHQVTDANGRYTLTTIVPGLYPGRTEHIHVKVQAANGPVLTSQLYFPGVPSNSRDNIFDAKTLITIQETSNGLAGSYNFVISR